MDYISVIITAHDRKKFLLDAVNSVLHQTIDRNNYEIIVVKNFHDFDDYLNEKNVKSIYTEEKPTGSKIAIGVEESRGDILCFLDDDDMFTREKLEVVSKEFKIKDLIFYNNSRIFIDENGKILRDERAIRLESDGSKNLRKFLENMSYNLSSICIRKEAVDTKKLKNIGYTIDILMLYFAINYGGKLLRDSKKLTLYRLSQYNFFTYSHPMDLNTFIAKRRNDFAFGLKISEKIKDEFKGSKAEKLALAEYLYDLFFYTIYSNTSLRNRLKSLEISSSYILHNPSKYGILLLGASILFFISPYILYSILYRRYLKNI